MKLWIGRMVRTLVVLVGIIVLTSFTIDATDSLNSSQSALSFLAKQVTETGCPSNMVELTFPSRSVCIDIYENSLHTACPIQNPLSARDTQNNINNVSCVTTSEPSKSPAVFVTFHQAQNFCARRGGRLPTSYEWYDAALGTPDSLHCNVDGALMATGAKSECTSARGVFDMVGNVWEWVDGEIKAREYESRTLPLSGYVAEADRAGVAIATQTSPDPLFNHDYFWSSDAPAAVMMRGGFYRSGEDGGVYSIHADLEPNFTSGAVGFRCVIDR